jgi:hypothetical protein
MTFWDRLSICYRVLHPRSTIHVIRANAFDNFNTPLVSFSDPSSNNVVVFIDNTFGAESQKSRAGVLGETGRPDSGSLGNMFD